MSSASDLKQKFASSHVWGLAACFRWRYLRAARRLSSSVPNGDQRKWHCLGQDDVSGLRVGDGLAIAAFVSILIVNLATPLFGMAFLVHMHKRLSGPRPELIESAQKTSVPVA